MTLENVTKSFGEKVLFQNVNLQISKGEKIALVAKNGSGKTTLLRVIAGEEAGEGELCKILKRKDIRIGYLSQEPEFFDDWSIMQSVFDSENVQIKAVRAYEEAMLNPDNTEAMEKALVAMDDQKAWDVESRIKEILFKLNITDLDRHMGTLSGGQRKRVALAKLLIDEPDFLIFDEPTNHLDMATIDWLVNFLKRHEGTVIVISHDRHFLNSVCTNIADLDYQAMRLFTGNYDDFMIANQIQLDRQQRENDKKENKEEGTSGWERKRKRSRERRG